MVFDNQLLDELLREAGKSPRLRKNLDIRNSPEDNSQRMLNALAPGTQLPIHRHRDTSETVVILKGMIREMFYDENGKETNSFLMQPNGCCVGLNIPCGTWHSLEVLEPSVIFESKDGAYKPLSEHDILTF